MTFRKSIRYSSADTSAGAFQVECVQLLQMAGQQWLVAGGRNSNTCNTVLAVVHVSKVCYLSADTSAAACQFVCVQLLQMAGQQWLVAGGRNSNMYATPCRLSFTFRKSVTRQQTQAQQHVSLCAYNYYRWQAKSGWWLVAGTVTYTQHRAGCRSHFKSSLPVSRHKRSSMSVCVRTIITDGRSTLAGGWRQEQ